MRGSSLVSRCRPTSPDTAELQSAVKGERLPRPGLILRPLDWIHKCLHTTHIHTAHTPDTQHALGKGGEERALNSPAVWWPWRSHGIASRGNTAKRRWPGVVIKQSFAPARPRE
ncbi:hypothetical protein CGCS363_v014080 [Colletotrichum siamense]|uniref:uncharacterized protein n=1 Tax=Colletotrichum siamense TaxID=690259 RepID=UPI001872AC7C|nr:uncharacterized protein CGCS363_v014080 [Colletotrichum siamense]KAF5484833.1 hypothetical protein CGCS363_v014080 [Colletotrichum siamense]